LTAPLNDVDVDADGVTVKFRGGGDGNNERKVKAMSSSHGNGDNDDENDDENDDGNGNDDTCDVSVTTLPSSCRGGDTDDVIGNDGNFESSNASARGGGGGGSDGDGMYDGNPSANGCGDSGNVGMPSLHLSLSGNKVGVAVGRAAKALRRPRGRRAITTLDMESCGIDAPALPCCEGCFFVRQWQQPWITTQHGTVLATERSCLASPLCRFMPSSSFSFQTST
jgi:hypothetical protein